MLQKETLQQSHIDRNNQSDHQDLFALVWPWAVNYRGNRFTGQFKKKKEKTEKNLLPSTNNNNNKNKYQTSQFNIQYE